MIVNAILMRSRSICCWITLLAGIALLASGCGGERFEYTPESPMIYDDAKWHSAEDFPDDLAEIAGATHIAMYFAWIVERELASTQHGKDTVQQRMSDPKFGSDFREYLMFYCDGKLSSRDLDSVGNRFTADYYEAHYIDDYAAAFITEGPTLYHVTYSLENYMLLKETLDAAFEKWRQENKVNG